MTFSFEMGPGFCPGCGMHHTKEHSPGCPITIMLRFAMEPPTQGPSLPCDRCGAHIDDCVCWHDFAPDDDDRDDEDDMRWER